MGIPKQSRLLLKQLTEHGETEVVLARSLHPYILVSLAWEGTLQAINALFSYHQRSFLLQLMEQLHDRVLSELREPLPQGFLCGKESEGMEDTRTRLSFELKRLMQEA